MPGKPNVRNDTLCPGYGAALAGFLLATTASADAPRNDTPANNYPTLARVEYVQECINRNGGKQTNMYQCVCVVDRIADSMSYDEFVESSTFAKYSTLPGDGGGIFRDTDEAKQKARLFRATEANALRACNLPASTAASAAPNSAAPAAPATTAPAPPAKDRSR